MTATIEGYCDERFSAVRDVLEQQIESGADLGASFSVTYQGETVVDLWGGHLDLERTTPWQEDTLVNVYSTTKTMSFLCALILADRGELDFDAPVSRYWPEFAAAGKSDVLVWHFMNHAAGLPGTDEPLAGDDLYDWEKVTDVLARQAPWWEPGSASGYHALTQGYFIGEVVRRITGQSLGQFFAETVAKPLQADFFIGVPSSEFPRISDLVPPPSDGALGRGGDADSIAVRTFKSPRTHALDSRTDAWRRAEIPAANGHGNARAVAKIHTALANEGRVGDIQLLSPEICKKVTETRISGQDLVFNQPMAFGLGFGLIPVAQNKRNLCFWGGWGGSSAVIDQDNRLSLSFAMNKMADGLLGDTRGTNLSAAVFKSLPK